MPTHWSYDATNLGSTTVGYYGTVTQGQRWNVRLLILDTDTNRQLFQDEEIDWQLTQEMNVYATAASLCDILVARARGVRGKKVGGLNIQYDPIFYRELAGRLRARGAGYQIPYAGGISVSDKLAATSDTDAVQPAFARGIEDNPWAPAPSLPPIQNSDSLLTLL